MLLPSRLTYQIFDCIERQASLSSDPHLRITFHLLAHALCYRKGDLLTEQLFALSSIICVGRWAIGICEVPIGVGDCALDEAR